MLSSDSVGDARSPRYRAPSRSRGERRTAPRRAIAGLTAAVLGLGMLLLGASPATAATTPDGRAATSTTIALDPADFSGTRQATASGTKQALNGVEVSLGATGATLCAIPASRDTTWSCAISALPDGATVTLTATETAPEGVNAPAPASASIAVLGPPTLDGAGSYLTTGLVSGTGRAGSTVSVSIEGAVDPNCSAVPVRGGTWSCNVARPSGGPYVVRAQQSHPAIAGGRSSAFSNVQNVTVDRDAPASAVIVSPVTEARVETQPLAVSGTGEEGASIDLYVDNQPLCSTIVRGGAWRCQVSGLPNGPRIVLAIQRDAAGNFADPSTSVRVWLGPRPAAVTPTPTPVPPAPSTSPTPSPSSAAPAPPGATPTPRASPSEDPLVFPDARGQGTPLSQALGNWGQPTGFGGDLASLSESLRSGAWLTALLAGALFVALVAIPARLLATGLRGRLPTVRARLTGRNLGRRAGEADATPRRFGWASTVAVSALLVVLAVGIEGDARYLRLLIAVAVGLAILTAVAAAAAHLAGREFGAPGVLRVVPLLLLGAAVTAIASRWSDLDPPLVAGVVIATAFTAGSTRARGLVSLVQTAALAAVGVVAWIGHGLLGDAAGFWGSAASELLAALCLAGLGSALLHLLPLATLPGRAILGWSPVIWLTSTAAVAVLTAAAVLSDPAAPAQVLPWLFACAGFAAVSLAIWAFARFVEPAMTPDAARRN